MDGSLTISAAVVMFIMYIIFDMMLRKKKNQSMKKTFFEIKLITNNRHKLFLTIDLLLLAALIFSYFYYFQTYPELAFLPLFTFLVVSMVLRGIEEWLYKREEKEYEHYWLGAVFFLAIISLITPGAFTG
ncbi:DUF4181 domain-containing protein [Evansella sp. LMS18]|jgi:hypothetical protein|uniref:DUF4181 domain-containing protein n=1 Tax=Evansella sp. LMS18 TaxID=2924033 RepID=UPI0020D1C8A5|nr:DUF4181 domain-containing protein [Evansella sp. LMS18]UTR09912.1 DUF4181 domain-containing protein [Evansella sp. LMS18]